MDEGKVNAVTDVAEFIIDLLPSISIYSGSEYEATRPKQPAQIINTTPADQGQAGADSQRPDKESEPWTKGK